VSSRKQGGTTAWPVLVPSRDQPGARQVMLLLVVKRR
jgi:hypothetical protein